MTAREMVTLYATHGGIDNAASILGVAELVVLDRAGSEAVSGEDALGMLAAARVIADLRRSLVVDVAPLQTPDVLQAIELEGAR